MNPSVPHATGAAESVVCPRCRVENPTVARFCGRCGLFLEGGRDAAGRTRHPDSLPPPEDFEPLADAADLYFRRLGPWGGSASLGVESAAVELFNGGYALRDVVLNFRGRNREGIDVFAVERSIADWPRGGRALVEVQSFEIAARAETMTVALVASDFAPADD